MTDHVTVAVLNRVSASAAHAAAWRQLSIRRLGRWWARLNVREYKSLLLYGRNECWIKTEQCRYKHEIKAKVSKQVRSV